MQKKSATLVVAVLAVISVIALVFFALEGGFGGRGYGREETLPRSFWLILFILPLISAMIIAGYIVTFPRIESQKSQVKPEWAPEGADEESTLEAVMRVLNEDERKVIRALAGGENETMLQKDIRWKTGLSRVKTHRVVARLAKRSVVSVEKYYNTNKIELADWLKRKDEQNKPT